ncbi:MAG: hypothetical protein QOD93_4066, partial [Acetobacteraceae bacterium]|nr:hypothetical protein [Acetobacteraceae bacterium]
HRMTSTARLAVSPVLSSRRRDFEPSGPGQARFGIRLVLGLDKPRSVWRLLRPAEIRAIDPHPMQDYANLARQGDLGSFCSTPPSDIHAPAFECGEARDTRQQDIGCLVERRAHHFVADAGDATRHISLPRLIFLRRQSEQCPDCLGLSNPRWIIDPRLERDRY